MIRWLLIATALAASAGASAQLRVPLLRRPPPPVVPVQPVGIDALRADFLARSGSDKVYFSGSSAVLSAPARNTLTAQAQWLRLNPQVQVRVEGHADLGDTRDHALAVGAARAEAVRDFLVLQGVPAFQITTSTLGKERPVVGGAGEAAAALNRRAVTVLVR